MGWRERSVVDERREFLHLASLEGANISALCARFAISRETGYVWLRRWRAGEAGLEDRSRRPHTSPQRTGAELEGLILKVRTAHPAWGARKIAAALRHQGTAPPAASTVHAVLVRHGKVTASPGGRGYGTFERDCPNELWQMDFKGKVKLTGGAWLHPLTVIDDASRFAVGLSACADQQGETVKAALEGMLRSHGLPGAFYVDNGTPWGSSGRDVRWTKLRVWLLKLGIETIYATPFHPQGRGKNERFHRALNAEVFALAPLASFAEAQQAFDRWRHIYNHQRPHQALGFARPAERYRPSPRSFPARLPEPQYAPGEIVRRIGSTKGYLSFRGRLWRAPNAFLGETLAIRPRSPDGCFAICFGAHEIASIDLNTPRP